MKKYLVALALPCLLILAVLPAIGERRDTFATGAGIIRINDAVRNFSFSAHVDEDGVARGRAQLHNRDSGTVLKMRLDCLRVEGPEAWMSGVNVQSTDEALLGMPMWFHVVDRGEGSGEPADQITLVSTFFGTGIPCTTDFVLPPNTDLIEIEGGNIQVHP